MDSLAIEEILEDCSTASDPERLLPDDRDQSHLVGEYEFWISQQSVIKVTKLIMTEGTLYHAPNKLISVISDSLTFLLCLEKTQNKLRSEGSQLQNVQDKLYGPIVHSDMYYLLIQ